MSTACLVVVYTLPLNSALPFIEMVCNTLFTACLLCLHRLWKWYATVLGNHVKLPKTVCNHFRQPLMETAYNRLSSYLPCYVTTYGNGVSSPKIPRTAAQAAQALSGLNSVRPCKTV